METVSRPSLADTLREETASLHQEAESHPWQRALLQGRVGRDVFAAHQAQMYLVQKELEASLRQQQAAGGPASRVVQEYHFRQDLLAKDLDVLGAGECAPAPATAGFLDWMRRAVEAEPAALIGVFYVVEGSTNGAKFIARALERALQLPGGRGLSYLDPHGEQLRTRWAAWRTDVNALDLTDAQRDAVVAAACRTFRFVSELMDELWAAAAA